MSEQSSGIQGQRKGQEETVTMSDQKGGVSELKAGKLKKNHDCARDRSVSKASTMQAENLSSIPEPM